MDVNLSEEDLETQIEIEADSLIPYPSNEVSLDFEKLDVNETDPSKVNVLLSAARTDSIDTRLSVIEEGGFDCKVIDVESYALSRASSLCLGQLPEEDRDKTIGLLDFGATMTLFTVVDNNETIYTRDQMFGGEQYTQSIMSYYNASYEEAEKCKVTNDMPPNYSFEVLAPFQTTLLQQVRRSIQMFVTTTGKEQIDALIVSGGTSLIEGIESLLIEEMGIHTVIADPFVDMTVDDKVDAEALARDKPRLMVAAGLAMRSFVPWHI